MQHEETNFCAKLDELGHGRKLPSRMNIEVGSKEMLWPRGKKIENDDDLSQNRDIVVDKNAVFGWCNFP